MRSKQFSENSTAVFRKQDAKIPELKYFQRAHHIINICIIIIITVIIIEFQKLKYFLDLNFSNTFQFSSNAFSPNQRLVPE